MKPIRQQRLVWVGGVAIILALMAACCNGEASDQLAIAPSARTSASAAVAPAINPTAATEGVTVTDPTQTDFDAAHRSWATLFIASVPDLQAGVPRLVTAQIAVKKATGRLYVGQQLRCVSMEGKQIAYGTRAGHNVNRGDAGKVLTASFVLTPKDPGDWACITQVSVCQPGACKGGSGSGALAIRTFAQSKVNYSFLAVSGTLPRWVNEHRLGKKDVPASAGKQVLQATELALPADGSQVMVLGLLGLTNCITATDPDVCSQASPRSLSASSAVRIGVRVEQIGTGPCAVRELADTDLRQRVITADEHHAHVVFSLQGFVPSTSPGCQPRARVTADVKVLKGNGVAFEAGSSELPKSWVAVVPSE